MSGEEICLTANDRALTLGADYVETRFQSTLIESILYKNGELEPTTRQVMEGIGIRVLIDGALGFSTTNIMSESSVLRAVEMAVKLAKASSRTLKEPIRFTSAETYNIRYMSVEGKRWIDIELSEKVGFLDRIDKDLSGGGFEVEFPHRLLQLEHRFEEKLYINSDGTTIESTVPRIGITYILTGVSEGRSIQRVGQIYASAGWEMMVDKKVDEQIEGDAKAMEKMLLKASIPPKEPIDLIVGPEVAGIMAHEAVGHPSEADRILGREAAQAGESYMTPKSLGKKIGSDEVSVSDDPTIPGSYGYYLYDDEGVKAGNRKIIEDGIIRSFLHNRETAAQFDVESNGASRAMSYSVEPIIRMANTYFEPGDYSFEELLEDVELGVYIRSFMEWNIDDKRINQKYTGLESYLVKKGEIADPVRNPVVEITTEGLLKSLDARGRDLEFWSATCGKGDPMQGAPVWAGGPHLRFKNIKVGTR